MSYVQKSIEFDKKIPIKILAPIENKALFLKSCHYINDQKIRMLHVIPEYLKIPKKYFYEVHGTDGTKIENEVFVSKNNLNKHFISFICQNGETYFIKIIFYYFITQSKEETDEFTFFYKVEDDFTTPDEEDEIDVEITKEESSNSSDEMETQENQEDDQEIEKNINLRLKNSFTSFYDDDGSRIEFNDI